MVKKLSAYKTYLLFSSVTALLFWMVFTVSMIYQVEKINLNPLQLILVETTLEATCFLFEIPAGIRHTFISGVIDAWIAREDKTKELDKIYLGGSQAGQIGSIIGVIATKISISVGIACTALLMTPVIVLYFLTMIMDRNSNKEGVTGGNAI